MKPTHLLTLFILILTLTQVTHSQINLATCLTSSQDKTFCLQCRNHYHLYQGLCYIDILGCEEYVYGNICKKCSNGYILVNNQCCDKHCMGQVYLKLKNSIENQQNQEQAIKKAEIEGYQKSVSVLAKNSIKIGQDYDIISTKSQYFGNIYRYQVSINIQGKQYIGILDYNIQTKQSSLVDLSLESQPVQPQINLNEQNIHSNSIYERGYKYIYMKYGLDLYELSFSRMTALAYAKTTELKFVFVGPTKAVIMTIVVGEEDTYTLWKEEKTNVEEITEYVNNLKQIQTLSKEQNFQSVFHQALTSRSLNLNQVQIVNITAVSKIQYIFIIYVKTLRIRYVIRGIFNPKTKTVEIKKMQEVFHPKLQDIKVPQKPQTKIIEKSSISSNTQAKQVFDFLIKVHPSFRQTQVDTVKIETGSEIKTVTIMQTKDNKQYRVVVLKDQKTNEFQLIDESQVVNQTPKTTIIHAQNDGTTSVTTNHIDYSETHTKVVMSSLKQNNIDTTTHQISSIQTVQGPKSIEYTIVLGDLVGNPTKEVTIIQSKQTNITTLVDITTVDTQVNYITPVTQPSISIPSTQFYKPQIKTLLTSIESSSEHSLSITKIKKIDVVNTTLASKYELVVENQKGQELTITAIQDKYDQTVEVISVKQVQTVVQTRQNVEVTNTKKVDSYGVAVEYTNDKTVLTTDQNVNIAVNYISSQLVNYKDYEVVSSLKKTYTQNQQQTLILTNGVNQVQITGTIDLNTLRYIHVQDKQIPITTTYPIVHQTTIPSTIYSSYIKDHKQIKEVQTILVEKYKMFKGKIPTTTTVQQYSSLVIRVTFTYEIGSKKFVAVVQYNTYTMTGQVVQMNPVQENVVAVTVQTKQINGQVITTSNSIKQIQSVNSNTNNVLQTITTQYPLIKKYNISTVKVIQSHHSDTFQVSYIDQSTNLTTVITTTSDKNGEKVTINDINTKSSETDKIVSYTNTQVVEIAKEEYSSTHIKQIVSFIKDETVSVTNINKITADIAPTFITYHFDVNSSDNSYNVTVIEQDSKKKEVVSVRSNSVVQTVTNVNVVSVDHSGNVIKETNNVTLIKESQSIQQSIKSSIETSTSLKNYDVKYVQTIDYGTTNQITVTFQDSKNKQTIIQTVTLYDETSKQTNVISVTPVPTSVHISHPIIPTTVIPSVQVEQAVKSDKGLQTVIETIHTSQTTLATATTVSVEHQSISKDITKYTVILESNGEKSQAVYVWNQQTKIATPIVVASIPSKVESYYITTTQTEEGIVVKSNNVTQISQQYPSVTNVLTFASTQQILSTSQQVTINSITLTPSKETITYTIDVTQANQHKTITFNQQISTNTIKLIDFNVETVETVYPKETQKVTIDISTHQELVSKFITIVKKTKGLETVKEIVSITKQTKEDYEKYFLEVITKQNLKYFVILGGKTGTTLTVLNFIQQIQTISSVSSIQLQQGDSYGNTIIQTTTSTQIQSDVTVQASIQTVIKENSNLQAFDVVGMRKIVYGNVEEIHLVFQSKEETTKQEHVETVVFYNKTSQVTNVVSVTTVPTEPSTQISTPRPIPSNFIPGFAITTLTQTNKGFQSVITSIKQTQTTAVTVSAESQTISQNVVKYTVVLQEKGVKSQAVYLWDQQTKVVTPIIVVPIPSEVQALYIKTETTSEGSTIIQTNNIKYIAQTHSDFKDVSTFITTTTGTQISLSPTASSSTSIQLTTQNNLNTYTVTITQEQKTKQITVNYDIKTHKTYLVNYSQEPIVATTVQVQYNTIEVKQEEKVEYLNWIKDLHRQDVPNPINIISIKSVKNALYSEAIIEVQSHTQSNLFIKTIKTHDSSVPTVISVTKSPLPHIEQTSTQIHSQQTLYISQQTTSTRTDSVGHIVTESTSTSFITNSEVIQAAIKTVFTKYTQYSDYTVKYAKTVRYTKAIQTILTLQRTTQDATIQVVTIYDQTTKITKIVSIRQLPAADLSVSPTPYPIPSITTVVIPQSEITTTIKSDIGLQSVITSNEIKTSSIVSAQVQTYESNINQYSIIVETTKGKQQFVSIFNSTSNTIQAVSISTVPTEIKSTVFTQTKINNQNIVISNQIDLIKQTYPSSTSTINAFIQQNPNIPPKQIESFIITPSSQTTSISIIATNQQSTKYVYNEYITTETKETVKVNSHIVPIIDLVRTRPIISVPVNNEEITSNSQITNQLIKIINTDTTITTLDTSKIVSIQKSQQTNVQIYTVNTLDNKNQQVSVEVIYNPATQVATVVDVAKVVSTQQAVFTETVVQEFTGKSSIVTTNVATIKESKEFKKISDLIVKNHPTESALITSPLIETTEKYQRAAIKTIVFSQESKTIQTTCLVDQRSNTIIELQYNTLESPLIHPTTLPFTFVRVTYTITSAITSAIKQNIALANTIKAAQKVDFSLANITPLFIQLTNYTSSATITLVFETPTSNSRVLAFFNYQTAEAKVVDYTKVAKIIEASKTIESTNQLGQLSVFTTNTKTITSTEQYKTVYSTAVKLAPSISGVPIKGVQTVLKQNGKEYTIISINNGIINQVVLQTNTATSEVTFISHTQTSVASEIVSVIPQPAKPIKVDIQTLQTPKYIEIAKTISTHTELNLGTTTIVSGTVTSNDFVETYNLVVRTQNNSSKVVTVTKDITTSQIIINNVQSPQPIPQIQIQTVTSQNQFGQIQTITNDYQQITSSEQTTTIIKKIIKKRPQLINARPISTKLITYGNTVQSTILFSNTLTPLQPIQVTSIMNTKTNDVEIVTSKQVEFTHTQTIVPITQIQTIPAPAIKIAAKKSTEINQIISLVQSVTTATTQIESLKTEDFGNVIKYTAVVQVPTGKQQLVYFYNEQTKTIKAVDTQTVAVVKAPVFYAETVNNQGETVITSTSVDKIIKVVPETSKAVDLLVSTYSQSFTNTIKSVQTKGTAIKQVKFVTSDTTNQQHIYTVLVDTVQNTVKILDVSNPIPSPKPFPQEQGGEGGETSVVTPSEQKGVRVTPAVKKNIEQVILNNVEIKEKFSSSTVQDIKQITTSYTNTYVATVKDQNNVDVTVTLIQNPGESIQVVNIQSQQSQTKTIVNTEISTQTTTSTVTGETKITTNNHQTIQSNSAIQQITSSLIKLQPQLIKYQPTSTQTISYGQIVQNTITYISEESSIQSVTLYNQTSKTVDVVTIKKIQKDTETALISVQTIPGSILNIAVRKMPEIKQIITLVQTATSKTTQIETLTVEDYGQYRKYIAIAVIQQGKHQSVYLYDKNTDKLKQISMQILSKQISAVNVEQTVTKYGQKVITSNNLQYISEKYTDTASIVKTVDTLFKQQTSSLTQSIQITQQPNQQIQQYKLVLHVNNTDQQVTVVKDKESVKVTHVEIISTEEVVKVQEEKKVDIRQTVETIDVKSTEGSQVTQFIQANTQLASAQIVSINSAESLLSTVYTVTVKDSANKVTVLQVLNQPGQNLSLISTNEVTQTSTLTQTVQQSITTKQTNQITGQTVTTSTDIQQIQSTENKIYIEQITNEIPSLTNIIPSVVQTTQFGNFIQKTFVIKQHQQIIQVTTLFNKTSQTVTIVDTKKITPNPSVAIQEPVTYVSVIPAALITATSTQITQIADIVTQIKTTTKKEVTLESITIQDMGNVNKYIATLPTPTNKQQFVYLYDKKEQTLTLIDSFTTSLKVQDLVYQQSTNQYGEVTVQSNSVNQVVSTIPQIAQGLTYIQTKYSAITSQKIDYVKVIQYGNFYQSTIVADSASPNPITIVLNINKQTKAVTEVSTYSSIDVQLTSTQTSTQISSKPITPIHPSDPLITKIIKFIESSKDVPINEIKSIIQANSTTTVFGSQVVTVEGFTTDLKTVQVVVSYNPTNMQITLVNFEILEVKQTSNQAVTSFKVDSLTGTKTTTTNDITVITSSQITTTLLKELQESHPELTTQTIISSTTSEYSDKVKVISVFAAESNSDSVTQITSIYDKSTASIRVVDSEVTNLEQITTQSSTNRQIYTNTEIQTAQSKIQSVHPTTVFIQKQFPIYINQNPSSIIVQQSKTIDFISQIYEQTGTTVQIVVMYNKTSGESTLIQSNTIKQEIIPYFYEQKKNTKGETVILSNSLSQVIQRIPKTEILQTYISKHHEINTTHIKTVQTVIGTEYNTYRLVTQEGQGLKQYEFIVNIQKDQVKQIENIKLPSVNDVAMPHPKPVIKVNPEDETVKPFITTIIESESNNLNSVSSIVSLTKTETSNVNRFEIEYVNQTNQVNKLIVLETNDKPIIVDERPIIPKFVDSAPIVVSQQIDSVTKTTTTTYVDSNTFSYDSKSSEILQYVSTNIPQIQNYTLQSATKSTYGKIQQYDILYKSADKAPIQISLANDNNNKNIILLQTKKITQQEEKNVLQSTVTNAKTVHVSEIEKENIKVLSKLGLVKNVQEYDEVSLDTIVQNQQFTTATEAVKQSYSVLLKQSVIIKVLQKKSLQSDNLKVFFKAKDQIFQADIEMNPITSQTKLTGFIKIGTQTVTKSEVNVYADLCYGYQVIEDLSSDSNIDFLLDYLKKKYETLSDSSLTEAQSIVLQSGRINYKFYFKKDGQTIKYIVYYEPEYKRVLEVKGTSFLIGDKYKSLPKEQQITDPYFRKLDTYIRQNNDNLNSALVLHTESKDDGQILQFRTVYTSGGKTYRSIASINKDNQNVNENALNEIIEVPTQHGPVDIAQNQQALSITKLDIHDLGKNLYFTEAHRFIQSKYQQQLDKAQLLGASSRSNLFSYVYKQFYMSGDRIITVSAEYNPVTQKTTISSEPQFIDIQEGYFPISADKKLTEVRNWLKEKNLDLSSSVLISSQSKQILFGTGYKLVFKDMSKYYTYVVYYDSITHQMKVLYEKDSSELQRNHSNQAKQAKLIGFARPSVDKTPSTQSK